LAFQCYDISQAANLTTVIAACKYRASFKEEKMYNGVPMSAACSEAIAIKERTFDMI
jgi:hypothetical protein